MSTAVASRTVYVDAAETSKLIRAALKGAYPAVKFSVRTDRYAGGASADVRWVDGPSTKEVDALLWQYRGATFDGMIDLQSSLYHEVDGVRVHYGTDYIGTHREVTVAFVQPLVDAVCDDWGHPRVEVGPDRCGFAALGNLWQYKIGRLGNLQSSMWEVITETSATE